MLIYFNILFIYPLTNNIYYDIIQESREDMKKGEAKMKTLSKKEITTKFTKNLKCLVSDRTMTSYTKRLEELLSDNVTMTSKAKYLQYKAVMSKLEQMGIALDVKLMKYAKRGDGVKKNVMDKYVSPEQLHVILNTCNNTEKGKELRLAIQISYYSGLRLEEVLNLKGSDIVMNGHIRLSVSGKGSKSRNVYLPQEQRQLVEGLEKFTISEGYVTKSIEIISQRTGIKFSFHSLRHSFASNLMRNGGNITLLQKLLGHSSMTTTAIYLHCVDETDQLSKLGF